MKFEDKNMEKSINLLAESRKEGRKEAIDEVLKLIEDMPILLPEDTVRDEIVDAIIEEVEKLKEWEN